MYCILYGLYCWAARRIAYRNDYCLSCADVRLAEQIRTFDVGHFFFIPLLPLGFRRRWFCSVCGVNPHERVATSQGFKIFAAAAFAVGTIFFWLIPIERPEDAPIAWGFRLVMTAAFLGALAWCRRPSPLSLKELLAAVPPLPRDVCALCGGALDASAFCRACQASRLEVSVPAHIAVGRVAVAAPTAVPAQLRENLPAVAKEEPSISYKMRGVLVALIVIIAGVGMTLHSWKTALFEGYFDTHLSAFGPPLACLGIAALWEPEQFYRRLERRARSRRRESWCDLTRRERVTTIVAIVAGLLNLYLLSA